MSISCQCWFSHERFLLLTSLQPSALCFKHSSALSIAPRLMDILKIVTHLHYIKITNTFKHKKLCNKNPHRISQILTYLYIILFSFTSKHLHNHLMLSFIWIFLLINIQMKMSMSTCFSITIAGIRQHDKKQKRAQLPDTSTKYDITWIIPGTYMIKAGRA